MDPLALEAYKLNTLKLKTVQKISGDYQSFC